QLIPKIGVNGFYLQADITSELEDCAISKDIKFLFAYLKDRDIAENIQTSIDQCFNRLWETDLYQKVKIKNKYIPLLKVVIPQQNKLKKSIWHDLLTSDDLVETLKKQELSKSKNLINDLENAKNDLFAKLMRALIFSLRSNDARANAELLDILSFHPLEYSFNRYLDHDHEILETQALRIMIQLSKNPEIKDIVSIVAIYLANNLTSEFATKLSFHF